MSSITHVQSLGPFLQVYIQQIKDNMSLIRDMIEKYLKLTFRTTAPRSNQIRVGNMCLARYLGGPFQRAKIVKFSGREDLIVYFIDFGGEQHVRMQEVRLIEYECKESDFLQKYSPQASTFVLSGIYCEWKPSQINDINLQLANQSVQFQIDMKIANFDFISVMWRHKNLVDYLVYDKSIGTAITLDKQEQAFARYINLHDDAFNNSLTRVQKGGIVQTSNVALGLHPVVQTSDILLQTGLRIPIVTTPPIFQQNSYGNPSVNQRLKNIANSIADIPKFKINTLPIGSVHDVYCCFVENGPRLFSVHLQTIKVILDRMMSDIEEMTLKGISGEPSVGMTCIARYSEDNMLYRAIIKRTVMPMVYQVFYVDYGNTENVAYHNLYEIPTHLLEHANFALRFALAGYKELEPISETMKTSFREMVLHKVLKLKVMLSENPTVVQYCELYDGPINVFETLKALKTKELLYGPADKFMNDELVIIRYAESPKRFFIQKVSAVEEFERMMDSLFIYCQKNRAPLTIFTKGTACAVEFDNAWYRAEILEQNGTMLRIKHVDFGYELNVNTSQLCTIPGKFIKFPPQAVKCCLKGLENANELSENATTQLEMLAETPDGERRPFKIHIFDDIGNGTLAVNLIGDSGGTELNLSKRLFKLNMPFNKYIVMEKDFDTGQIGSLSKADESIGPLQPPAAASTILTTNDVMSNTTHFVNTKQQVQSSTTRPQREWEEHSSTSSDQKSLSPVDSYRRQGQDDERRPFKTFGNGYNRRENNYYKAKQNLPPRFQRQQEEIIRNRQLQNSNEWSKANLNSSSMEKLNTSGGLHNQTENGFHESSPQSFDSELTAVVRYLPFETKFSTVLPIVPSEEPIVVCWWVSPHEFSIHTKEKVGEFEKMMRKMQMFYKDKPATVNPPTVESSVVARNRDDNFFYRARVLACSPLLEKFKVQFVDFGNKSVVDLSNIWQIDTLFADHPVMAQLCSLDNVLSNEDHAKITNHVEKYLVGKHNLICKYLKRDENDLHYVDIIIDKSLSLKEILIEDGFLSPIDNNVKLEMLTGQPVMIQIFNIKDLLNFQVKIEGCELKLMSSYYDIKYVKANSHLSAEFKKSYEGKSCAAVVMEVSKEKILLLKLHIPLFSYIAEKKINDLPIISKCFNVRVVYVYTENILYVHPTSSEDSLYQLLDDLYNYYSVDGASLDHYTNGTLCAANSSDGNWYRACITNDSKSSTSYDVYYLDYGNTETIHTADDSLKLKKLEEKFYNPSALAVRVFLPIKRNMEESINDNEAVVNEIKELTNDMELSLQILERYKNDWIVDIFLDDCSLINILKDKSLCDGMNLDFVKSLIDNEKHVEILTKTPTEIPVLVKKPENGVENHHEISSQVGKSENDVGNQHETSSEASEPKEINTEIRNFFNDMMPAQISHANNPGWFYLQLDSKSKELEKMQENLQIVASSLAPLTARVNGGYCIARYHYDNLWYRAKILDSESIAIYHLDYGSTDVITNSSNVKAMNEAFENIEPFAIPCSLAIAPNGSTDWMDEAREIFQKAIDEEKTVYFDYIAKGEKKNFVRLRIDGSDVAQKLIENGVARQLEVVRSGENCFVSHVNSIGDFYIQMESDAECLELITDHLQTYEDFQILDNPSPGTICAALFPDDEAWYRVKVLTPTDAGQTDVLFIDYGNTTKTTQLRAVSNQIANVPCLSKRCSLEMPDHILGWSDAAETLFDGLAALGETVFVVELKEPGERAIVNLYKDSQNIVDQLEPVCDIRPNILMNLSVLSMESDFILANLTEAEISTEIKSEESAEDYALQCGVISHYNNSQDFYVQLNSDLKPLEMMTDRLYDADVFTKLEDPKVGDICAALFPDDGAFYRAHVISRVENSIEVVFIDFGNTSVSEDLRQLPDELKNTEKYAKHCQLYNFSVQNEGNLRAFIDSRIGEEFQIRIIKKTTTPWIVQLLLEDTDIVSGLLTTIESAGLASDDSESNESLDIVFDYCFVSHSNTPNDFYIQFDRDVLYLKQINEILSDVSEMKNLEDCKVNTLCAALSDDGNYYRAKIQKIVDTEFEVFYIDYGNFALTDELRQLPPALTEYDNLAKHCALQHATTSNGGSYSDNVIEQFNTCVGNPDVTFQLQIIESNVDPWIVNLYDAKGKHITADLIGDLMKSNVNKKDSSGTLLYNNILENIIENTISDKLQPDKEVTISDSTKNLTGASTDTNDSWKSFADTSSEFLVNNKK